jgi:hypothetical protein
MPIFILKNHEDNFKERYHQNDRFWIVYFETMLNLKSIIYQLELSFKKTLFWFNFLTIWMTQLMFRN